MLSQQGQLLGQRGGPGLLSEYGRLGRRDKGREIDLMMERILTENQKRLIDPPIDNPFDLSAEIELIDKRAMKHKSAHAVSMKEVAGTSRVFAMHFSRTEAAGDFDMM